MIGHIQDQVLAHDGQTDEAEISTGVNPRWSADIDAGKTGAIGQPNDLVRKLQCVSTETAKMASPAQVSLTYWPTRHQGASTVGGRAVEGEV